MNWWQYIKTHKLTVFLILVILYLLFNNFLGLVLPFSLFKRRAINYPATQEYAPEGIGGVGIQAPVTSSLKMGSRYIPSNQDFAPEPSVTDRKVIQESQLSLQVKNVREATDKIIEYARSVGGYMVNTSLRNPGEAPAGTITVRIPQAKFDQALAFFRNLSIKVVWENLTGEDVTDQYIDIDARLATLYKTKLKFEEILNTTIEISDILNIQREIINLQSQIDALKGQQNYLDKSAQMAKITIHLSTDEFSLPYAPSATWRPEVIFKQAVRNLISNLRKVGTMIIWLVVYSVVLVPVGYLILRLKNKIKASKHN